jgi:chromosome segregation ATPase
MTKTREQLELEYGKVKADIKVQLTMLKAHADAIQSGREKVAELAKQLEDLQNQYRQLEAKEE